MSYVTYETTVTVGDLNRVNTNIIVYIPFALHTAIHNRLLLVSVHIILYE